MQLEFYYYSKRRQSFMEMGRLSPEQNLAFFASGGDVMNAIILFAMEDGSGSSAYGVPDVGLEDLQCVPEDAGSVGEELAQRAKPLGNIMNGAIVTFGFNEDEAMDDVKVVVKQGAYQIPELN